MQKKTEPLRVFELKPSKRLKLLLVIIHTLALVSSLVNALPHGVKLVLVFGICIHFIFTMKRLKKASYTIKHSEALNWELATGNEFKPVQIMNSTVIGPYAIFLHCKADEHKQYLLIANDALSEDDFRHLVVRLKTAGKAKQRIS